MKLLTEKIENSQAIFQIEVEDAELDASMEEAYKRLRPRVSVPGFRKGKAPRVLVEQQIGKETLLGKALEHLVPQLVSEVIKSRSLEAVAEPQIKITQTNPVTVEAIIPLPPKVKLGDYKSIRLEPELIEVSDDDVESAISQAREQQGTRVPVERPVQYGDLVTMDIEGVTEGKSFLKRKDMSYEVVKDLPVPLPGFAEKLVDMEKNEEKAFIISFPSDYEAKELAGKEFSFKAVINEIKEKRLPELNDEFAKSLGHDSLDLVRAHVKTQLNLRAEEIGRRRFEQKVIGAVIQLCEVDYSPILVNKEIERVLEEEASNFKDGFSGLEAYLKNSGKTLDQHREDLRPMAVRRITQALVLDRIAKEEELQISNEEIDEEIGKVIKNASDQREELQKILASPKARRSIERSLLYQKTVDRLVKIAKGEQYT